MPMTLPESCTEPTRLKALLDGTLPEHEQTELQRHLETCAHCQHTLEGLVAGQDSWSHLPRRLAGPEPGAEGPVAKILDQFQENQAGDSTLATRGDVESLNLDFLSPSEKEGHLGRLDHYEVLEVLGRGSMGV